MSGTKNKSIGHKFTFDRIYTPDDSQEKVFDEIQQLVQSAIDGYNVCIFAYGQTGSGKTFTMEGNYKDQERRGVIPRTSDLIFQRLATLEPLGWHYAVKGSYLEIYNETIRDLLVDPQDLKKKYSIKFMDDKKSAVRVTDLKGNFRVFCRLRPFTPTEIESNGHHHINIDKSTLKLCKNAKMAGRKEYIIWDLFEKKIVSHRKGRRAICISCRKEVEGQISRMRAHLAECRRGENPTEGQACCMRVVLEDVDVNPRENLRFVFI